MVCLRLVMVGAMSILFCFSNILSAQVSSVEPVPTPPTNAMVDVWGNIAPAIELPGSHHLTTNASGTLVHTFNIQPVVTNMTVLTNDLLQLEQKLAPLDQEMKALPPKERILRAAWLQDNQIIANIVTNFVPADAEGQKIKARMNEIEKELKQLRGEIKKRLEVDPEFQKAKAKLDEDAATLKDIQDRKTKMREESSALRGQIWAINELKKRDLAKRVSQDAPKTVAP